MKFVVVESPAKVKTIKKYLGKGFKVAATMGHFVDLPKKELGVDVEKNYKPKYKVTSRKALKRLKKEFGNADTLVIATDPDREGEAIGWHVAWKLGLISKKGKKKGEKELERIVFTSITKDAVQKAIENSKGINFDLVHAQQARRVLDRLVGYKLSPLIWKKIRYGLSAGRVQSVAVRLIVDKEIEREKFDPKEYWRLFSDLHIDKVKGDIEKITILDKDEKKARDIEYEGIKFKLRKINGKSPGVKDKKEAEKIMKEVEKSTWKVTNVKKKSSKRYPKPPFITSTLQRTLSNMFGYSAYRSMSVAQKLYEAGHITYMRTDSFNIVSGELKKIRKYVKTEYGDQYLTSKEKRYKSKSKTAQEAHEAIRPTNIEKDAKDLGLKGQQAKVYDLIRNRAMASQMNPARLENTILQVKIDEKLFQSKGKRIVFDGYLKAYPERISENILPEIKQNQILHLKKLVSEQKFTSPPARYSEATLIKTLEKYGIGRPSTYAPIISTILKRKYVVKEGKYFVPTTTGRVVTKLLKKYFENIVDTGFTAKMEDRLDEVASGEAEWVKVIDEFYKPFIKKVEKGEKNISKDEFKILGKSKYKCPDCGKKMVKKLGRFGPFLSCSDFPKCKGMRSVDGKTEEDKGKEMQKQAQSADFKKKYLSAPKSEDGKKMILKSGKYGKFWAHPDYPKTKETKPLLLKEDCPKCGEPLVERKGKWGKTFIGCSGYPDCKYIKKKKKKK